ncbi:hypothetical protein SAMN05444159_1285 [Bradyrhizobium lablabi]|uniref:Uncharacterized protein n=1 Tax=Bradyrhizobium lablabi TaxID=722472 RepID=A0A1M6LIG8_9BRAD|nr:hypothetical protein SAMN05444159_1285 [Bradyrhizobium lablabi]
MIAIALLLAFPAGWLIGRALIVAVNNPKK